MVLRSAVCIVYLISQAGRMIISTMDKIFPRVRLPFSCSANIVMTDSEALAYARASVNLEEI